MQSKEEQVKTFFTYSESGHWQGAVRDSNGDLLFKTGNTTSLTHAKLEVMGWLIKQGGFKSLCAEKGINTYDFEDAALSLAEVIARRNHDRKWN